MVGFAFGFAFLLIVLLQWMTALATIKKSHHISGMIGTEPNGNCGCLIVIFATFTESYLKKHSGIDASPRQVSEVKEKA